MPGTKPHFDDHRPQTVFALCLGALCGIGLGAIAIGVATGEIDVSVPIQQGLVVIHIVILAGVGCWGVVGLIGSRLSSRLFHDAQMQAMPNDRSVSRPQFDVRIGPLEPRRYRASFECIANQEWTEKRRDSTSRRGTRNATLNRAVAASLPLTMTRKHTDERLWLSGTVTVPTFEELKRNNQLRPQYIGWRRWAESKQDFKEEHTWALRLRSGRRSCWFVVAEEPAAESLSAQRGYDRSN